SLVLHALVVNVNLFPSPCFAILNKNRQSVGERRIAGKRRTKSCLAGWHTTNNRRRESSITTHQAGPLSRFPAALRQMQRHPSSSLISWSGQSPTFTACRGATA